MDRVAQEGKMKEKENEITDLADCTNHAYHVLWLARRIQHLWITVAVIVHECKGMEVGGDLCVAAYLCTPSGCWCDLQVCFCWHGWIFFYFFFKDRGKMIKRKLRERLLFASSAHLGRATHSPHGSLTEASFTIVITLFIYPTCFWW